MFSWSYDALSPPAAQLFRLIGLHPGPDIDLHAAASLAATPVVRTRAQLAELTAAHLLQEHTAGRYRFHDLLRAYASRCGTEDPAEQQRSALRRVFDHYLHTGFTADQCINPGRQSITLDAVCSDVSIRDIANDDQAWEWFAAERPVLIAAVDYAHRHQFDRHAWQLPWVMATFLDRRGYWLESAAVHEIALAAVTRLADHPGGACIHRFLGWTYTRLRQYSKALTHLQAALAAWQELDDIRGQASAEHGLSLLYQWQNQYARALDHAEQALDLSRVGEDTTGEATVLNTLGWNYARLGRHDQAMAAAEQALNLFRQFDDHFGQAEALDILGYTYRRLEQQDQACSSYQECLAFRRKTGDHYLTATTLIDLGETYCALDELALAGEMWQQSLAILERLGHPDATQVRVKLAALP